MYRTRVGYYYDYSTIYYIGMKASVNFCFNVRAVTADCVVMINIPVTFLKMT